MLIQQRAAFKLIHLDILSAFNIANIFQPHQPRSKCKSVTQVERRRQMALNDRVKAVAKYKIRTFFGDLQNQIKIRERLHQMLQHVNKDINICADRDLPADPYILPRELPLSHISNIWLTQHQLQIRQPSFNHFEKNSIPPTHINNRHHTQRPDCFDQLLPVMNRRRVRTCKNRIQAPNRMRVIFRKELGRNLPAMPCQTIIPDPIHFSPQLLNGNRDWKQRKIPQRPIIVMIRIQSPSQANNLAFVHNSGASEPTLAHVRALRQLDDLVFQR